MISDALPDPARLDLATVYGCGYYPMPPHDSDPRLRVLVWEDGTFAPMLVTSRAYVTLRRLAQQEASDAA